MHSIPTMKRGCVLLLSLCVLMMMVDMSSAIDFSWSDCGVQLYKDIHYQSAAISPGTAVATQQLAINVQATISDRIIYDADTRLMVWKDGQLFLDVEIDKLCSIIASTNALSCPLKEGLVSFTYEFDKVPTLVSGAYVIQIKNYDGTPGSTYQQEIGCIQFTGSVKGAEGNSDKCMYESTFSSQFKSETHYTTATRADRKKGDLIQVGPIGNLSNSFPYGQFVGDFIGSADLGGQTPSKPYSWALNGTLQSHTSVTETNGFVDVYYGNFYVVYQDNSISYQGYFNWTFEYNPSKQEQVTGTMWLDPQYYYYPAQFDWPVIVGNLGQFKVRTLANGNNIVEGSRKFCTCGVDACGVCNGNGKTCGLGVPEHKDDDWGARKIAAVACGCVAFVLLGVVIDLARRIRREKRRIPIDDQDLLDHPEKPDYGTMAIDDAIREGERVAV